MFTFVSRYAAIISLNFFVLSPEMSKRLKPIGTTYQRLKPKKDAGAICEYVKQKNRKSNDEKGGDKQKSKSHYEQ